LLLLPLLLPLLLLLLLSILCCVQVDMLDSQEEVAAVLDFVSSNTSKLLQVCPTTHSMCI
jgi:hypothetical protein